jgi:16S rRNA G966 N2-methylase RsmD
MTDPPWTAIDTAERALARLLDASLLTPDGQLVVGHPKGRPLTLRDDAGLELDKQRAWGDSAATFYSLAEPAPLL